MKLERLEERFTIAKLSENTPFPKGEFVFCAVTDGERSLVCPTALTPCETTDREDGWRAFRIVGTLDFSLVGILAGIGKILADEKIGIFAVSTFNTDYVLMKEENFETGVKALEKAGYVFL